jgi:hypothetical protein
VSYIFINYSLAYLQRDEPPESQHHQLTRYETLTHDKEPANKHWILT